MKNTNTNEILKKDECKKDLYQESRILQVSVNIFISLVVAALLTEKKSLI